MERQEAQSLSRALQHMDAHQDAKSDAAAQEEAAYLIWKHQNPSAPYANPDCNYRHHLKKGSHARSQSIGPYQDLYVRKQSPQDDADQRESSRKVSSGSDGTVSTQSSRSSSGTAESSDGKGIASLRNRAIAGLSMSISKTRRLSGRRASSKESTKATDEKLSTAPFSNPDDRIYEEPENTDEGGRGAADKFGRVLRTKHRNASSGTRAASTQLSAKNTDDEKLLAHHSPKADWTNELRLKNGVEVRSDEIRAATSKKRNDRSPRLPQPSVVSDRLGRPIVSFDKQYKSSDRARESGASAVHPLQEQMVPNHPARTEPDALAQSNSQNPSEYSPSSGQDVSKGDYNTKGAPGIPSITFDDESSLRHGTADEGNAPQSRPKTHPKQGPETSRSSHWTPASGLGRMRAQCSACALPIEGKIVSAAGERFHPECFTCYHCGELLECVAFYPEPSASREERLQLSSSSVTESELNSLQKETRDEGHDGLRFFCHLDYHERFSPRCRTCKTPIEGKVILACGAEWHEGHFFCAECGDPFDKTTPFVEKNGYAWCVPCHTRRFSGKCAGCRKPIVDIVVQALDQEWHADCFCCGVGSLQHLLTCNMLTCQQCGSPFHDGRFFSIAAEKAPICFQCEERRLKA